MAFSVIDDTLFEYTTYRSGGLALGLETDTGITAGDPMTAVLPLHPAAYTAEDIVTGSTWLQSDHFDGENSLRFHPESGDPTTINLVQGGTYYLCSP